MAVTTERVISDWERNVAALEGSICRKTAGGGGYAINLGAKLATLKVTGEKNITKFHARIDGHNGHAERGFCKKCGSALWVWDKQWPDLVHPFASAIDSDLPPTPSQVHMMLGSKANWVRVDARRGEQQFDEYPEQSLEDWHRAQGLLNGDRAKAKKAARKK